MSDTEITHLAIHPGVGIARVGNSEEEDGYFIGPEVPGAVPDPPGGFKDSTGAVKRQAARFRIYGYNAAGDVVKEITADDANIEWRVHVANRKSGWYQFQNAMDLGNLAKCTELRNGSITGSDREKLVIDPGSRSISGKNQGGGKDHRFDTGKFMDKEVYLGELRTDEKGRLLFLGGHGHSASYDGSDATTFANNDKWHDDTSDGPVRAKVELNGKTYEAEPAVVATTPPNYGQGLYGVVTMYDVVYDLFARDESFPLKAPEKPSFHKHIYPMLKNLSENQWVNSGISILFGHDSPSDFNTAEMVKQLGNPGPESQPLRQRILAWARDPEATVERPVDQPPFYGDAFGDFENVPGTGLPVTRTQYAWLKQWAIGNFTTEEVTLPKSLDDYPESDQAHALDRANLEDCLGGPFHPGIEITWTMRVASMWQPGKLFRLNVLEEGAAPKMDYGPTLHPETALAPGGVVDSSGPGTLTWWMGVPWQTDEASCKSGYDIATYLRLPSFWAARVPNQVMSERSYDRFMDTSVPLGQRLKHLHYRQDWLRYFGSNYVKSINANTKEWFKVGIIAPREGPSDHEESGLPSVLWTETQLDRKFTEDDPTFKQVLIAETGEMELEPDGMAMAVKAVALETPIVERRRTRRRDEL